jgi:hypothetical protein
VFHKRNLGLAHDNKAKEDDAEGYIPQHFLTSSSTSKYILEAAQYSIYCHMEHWKRDGFDDPVGQTRAYPFRRLAKTVIAQLTRQSVDLVVLSEMQGKDSSLFTGRMRILDGIAK